MHQSQIQDTGTESDSEGDDAPKNPYYNPETNKERARLWAEHFAGQYGCDTCRKPGTGMFVAQKNGEPKLVFSEPNPIDLCCDEGRELYSKFLEYGANTSKPGAKAWGYVDWHEDNSIPQK